MSATRKRSKRLRPKTSAEIRVDPSKATLRQLKSWEHSIKNKPLYNDLRREGFDKTSAAKISNSKAGNKAYNSSEAVYDEWMDKKVAQGPKKFKKKLKIKK